MIDLLEFVKDKVIVTGSYAENKQTPSSDIDFYVKELPEEEKDFETGRESYLEDIIAYLDQHGIKWDSVMIASIHTNRTYIPLEFSILFSIDEEKTFDIEILGVKLKASVTTHGK